MTNILILVADQLRADITYHEKYPDVRTPGIDSLRSEGIAFTNAYCQYPVCGPSRASITTGRYPRQHGVLVNRALLPDDERTFGHHFADNGYDTVAFGKTHGQNPGFDRFPEPLPFADTLGTELTGYFYGESMLGTFPTEGGRRRPVVGVYEGDPSEQYDHVVNGQFAEFLAERSGTRPFVAWVGYHSPHPPLIVPRHLHDLYPSEWIDLESIAKPELKKPSIQARSSPGWREAPAEEQRQILVSYLAMISHLDECVGEAIDLLTRRQLLHDTIVVLTADHGEQMGEHGILSKFNNFYDSSIRVPLIISSPNGLGRASMSSALVELVDLYPTLCALTGIPVPGSLGGRSFEEALLDPSSAHREYVSCTLVEKRGHSTREAGKDRGIVRGEMVRTEEWKLAVYSDGTGELYSLRHDPNEDENLYESPDHQRIRSELHTKMIEHMLSYTRRPPALGLNHFPG